MTRKYRGGIKEGNVWTQSSQELQCEPQGCLEGKDCQEKKKTEKNQGQNIGEYIQRDPGKGLFKEPNQDQMKDEAIFLR